MSVVSTRSSLAAWSWMAVLASVMRSWSEVSTVSSLVMVELRRSIGLAIAA